MESDRPVPVLLPELWVCGRRFYPSSVVVVASGVRLVRGGAGVVMVLAEVGAELARVALSSEGFGYPTVEPVAAVMELWASSTPVDRPELAEVLREVAAGFATVGGV